jgi:MoCo/4Fe-4S cofactor protein with predicted Tat translocation signal
MGIAKKTYWKGLPELTNDPAHVKHADKEFVDMGAADEGHSRRDFLKMMGFSVAAASLAACEAPIRKAIPYVVKPMDADAGIPNYYASTYVNGGDYCSVVVKVRDGRPIKLDGNSLSSISKGGTSAQVEASVLSLYDNFRLRGPRIADKATDWESLDKEVIAKLEDISSKGGQIRIVSNTILSPSTKATIEKFKAKYPTASHIQYDPISYYGLLKANEESFGKAIIPSYEFSRAKVIVSIGADFLGTWLSPIEFTKGYAATRQISEDKRDMSRHFQFESNLSLTGANADYRGIMKPSQEAAVLTQIYNIVAGKSATDSGVAYVEKAAKELLENKGASLVVSSSNDKEVQVLVNEINNLLGNYGSTIRTSLPINFRQGNDEAMAAFIEEATAGKIGGVIFYNCNPVYDCPQGQALAAALRNTSLSVSTSYTPDETASSVGYMAPDHHYLESWNDFEPKLNYFSLSQPAITPIFKTRQAQESFLVWAGESDVDYYSIVNENWKNWFFNKQSAVLDFQSFWDKCLYEGVYEIATESPELTFTSHAEDALSNVGANAKTSSGFELIIYESYGIGNGNQANNPLLQELPDPITKATWDHYVTVSQKDARETLKLGNDAEGHTKLVTIRAGDKSIKLPALIQPGQAPGTIGIALGYGRTKVGAVAEGIGTNVYPLVSLSNGSLNYSITSGVLVSTTEEDFQLAQTQIHQTYMGRGSVIQESILSEFKQNPAAGREYPKITNWDEKVDPGSLSLWKGHEYKNHYWGMSIDLNTCTGCAACVVACNVENNVALVGKQEVINRREMHWLRIDRYYSSDANPEDYKAAEIAAENPEVVFQPMMCQHCNNAPCETVCPVAATTHSTEGLNQMTYNRCIGTRYCANNCPYKVRRFNWFKYHDNQQFYQANPAMNTDLGRMVLNPEVTVRSRGVMEKCSFCVQRIQTGKLTAKKERRPLKDGEVVTACQAACSTGAIVFGDMNNPESSISKLLKIESDPKRPYGIDKKIGNPRAYRVLEEIGVKPNIFYLTKIKNKDEHKEHA